MPDKSNLNFKNKKSFRFYQYLENYVKRQDEQKKKISKLTQRFRLLEIRLTYMEEKSKQNLDKTTKIK